MSGLIYGQTAEGKMVPLQVNDAGQLVVSGTVGGGGGSSGGLTNSELRAAAVVVTGPLTDAQLRAAAVPVNATTRTCVGRETIALAATTVTSLTVPGGALACDIQADGNTIRVTLNGSDPSATVGTRIDDGVIYPVVTALASVRLFAPVACAAQVVYFDKP